MIEKEHEPLTREDLLGYWLEDCTPRRDWRLGMEFEKLGVDAATGRRIRYSDGRASVRTFLERYLDRRGGDPVYEGINLVGADGAWGTLSLEPGGQVEWSSLPLPDLDRLGDELNAHVEAMTEVGQELGIRWLDDAMDPSTALSEVPWMPKARYKILAPYLGARGRLAHWMMTQTTSIQVAFDYESPEDWARKFRAAALIAPVAVALFANSPRADNRETGYRSYRQAVWRETDPDRCGLPPVVFEPGFGMEAWLEWALDTPSIFLRRARGLVPAGGVTFRELMNRRGCRAVCREDWELHLSAIFTDVRSSSYIEVRSADLQPYGTIMAVPALWAGLLYDDAGLETALEIGAGHDDHALWVEAMQSASRLGLDGRAGDRPLRDLARRAVGTALRVLRDGGGLARGDSRAVAALERLAAGVGLLPREASR